MKPVEIGFETKEKVITTLMGFEKEFQSFSCYHKKP